MKTRFCILIALVLSAFAYAPARSYACSCATGMLRTDPQDAQAGVPRNRAIQLSGPVDPSTVVLETFAGVAHAFEQRAFVGKGPCGGDYSIELMPTPALEPDTQYRVRATQRTRISQNTVIDEPVSFRFTTSSELLPDPELELPSAELVLVMPPPDTGTSCGPYAATGCLSADEPNELKMILRDGDAVTSEAPISVRDTPVLLWTMPTCIDIVRQAPTGRRSPALSFCGDDLKLLAKPQNQCQAGPFAASVPRDYEQLGSAPAMAVAGEGAPQPRAASGYEIHGCAAAPGERAGYGSFALMFGLLALLRTLKAPRSRPARDRRPCSPRRSHRPAD